MDELKRLTPEGFRDAPKTPFVLILDDVRSLYNIGSVFRTADAFLLTKIYLCGITATPPHREIQKTALGATESVAWEYRKDAGALVQELRSSYRIVAVEQTENSTSLLDYEPDPSQAYALVFGNEVKGIKQEVLNHCDGVVEIPQFGTKHSLNISVSAGITIWHFFARVQSTAS